MGALFLLVLAAVASFSPALAQGSQNRVYVVEIHGEIDLGLVPYLNRSLRQAQEEGAPAVVLDINTPGGRLDAVLQMRESLLGSPVRTVAFVNREAFSAGALVALASRDIYMAPGAVMGAATPVDGAGETASEKTISAVRTTFKSTAEVRDRNPHVAEAMVDPSVEIDGLVEQGRLLTLTANEARKWGYADGVVSNTDELLEAIGHEGAAVEDVTPRLAENLVRFLTSPVVASLLLSFGFLLILADAFTEGFGAIGAAGLG
ncbi:MAG: ATP-dependent Clp protease proteolytic subunit, partial [Actinomycetota bacterium]|nr:ATP-dependent Clp protease proteolytic subunit [Actinomycetota bacterium]